MVNQVGNVVSGNGKKGVRFCRIAYFFVASGLQTFFLKIKSITGCFY